MVGGSRWLAVGGWRGWRLVVGGWRGWRFEVVGGGYYFNGRTRVILPGNELVPGNG